MRMWLRNLSPSLSFLNEEAPGVVARRSLTRKERERQLGRRNRQRKSRGIKSESHGCSDEGF